MKTGIALKDEIIKLINQFDITELLIKSPDHKYYLFTSAKGKKELTVESRDIIQVAKGE